MKYDSTVSDPTLIEKCLSGDETAWETLISRYERLIYATCRRYSLDQTEAEDIFGRICLMLLQHLETLKDRTRLGSWLVTTTSRECWHFKKSRSNLKEITTQRANETEVASPLDELVDEGPLPEEALIQLERQQLIRENFQQLPERCRKLLWLLFYDPAQPSYTDISAALDIPVASIGPNRARCLDRLRKKLPQEV